MEIKFSYYASCQLNRNEDATINGTISFFMVFVIIICGRIIARKFI